MATSTKRIPTPEDRKDLLRALAMWTGQFDVAEDLVQQTLFEAWRSDRQPERDEEWRPWLFGVARNVLLRWQRDMGKHGFLTPRGSEDERVLEMASAADDLDSLLTAFEMVSLLDDLLGRLPMETRDALVLKYVADLPQAEVAHRLGMHEKALEGRLYRGKKALKRALITDRPDTAISLGLIAEPGVWQEIDALCPACGQRRLAGRWFEHGGFHGHTMTPVGSGYITLLQTHAPKAMIGRIAATMNTCIRGSLNGDCGYSGRCNRGTAGVLDRRKPLHHRRCAGRPAFQAKRGPACMERFARRSIRAPIGRTGPRALFGRGGDLTPPACGHPPRRPSARAASIIVQSSVEV